jgi:RNA recognition motif-containing protein
MKRLFVGGIPYKTSEAELQELFSQAGAVVSATILTERGTGRSKGFGFVEMASDEEAGRAQEMFDNKEFEGRILKVNEARPKEPRNDRGYSGHRGGGYNSGYNNYGGSYNNYGGGYNDRKDRRW